VSAADISVYKKLAPVTFTGYDRLELRTTIKGMLKNGKETDTLVKNDEGEVMIRGKDSLDVYLAKKIITAISRGFKVKEAMKLTKEDYVLEVINIHDVVGDSKKTVARVKSRVIGREGTCKKRIEEETNTDISIYGKTISVIGECEDARIAREAILMLLSGCKHSSTYAFMNKEMKKKIQRQAMQNMINNNSL